MLSVVKATCRAVLDANSLGSRFNLAPTTEPPRNAFLSRSSRFKRRSAKKAASTPSLLANRNRDCRTPFNKTSRSTIGA